MMRHEPPKLPARLKTVTVQAQVCDAEVSHRRPPVLRLPNIVLIAFDEDSFTTKDIVFCLDTLNNRQKGWASWGVFFFMTDNLQRADIHMFLSSPERLTALYPTAEMADWSITRGDIYPVRIDLNLKNWMQKNYHETVEDYRRYVLNHEIGHALGFAHDDCPGAGRPACIMMQQTHGVKGCLPSAWPRDNDCAPCLTNLWEGISKTMNHFRTMREYLDPRRRVLKGRKTRQ